MRCRIELTKKKKLCTYLSLCWESSFFASGVSPEGLRGAGSGLCSSVSLANLLLASVGFVYADSVGLSDFCPSDLSASSFSTSRL